MLMHPDVHRQLAGARQRELMAEAERFRATARRATRPREARASRPAGLARRAGLLLRLRRADHGCC